MKELKIKKLNIDDLLPTEENPNVMKDSKFNSLTKTIEEVGYDQPCKVWWNEEKKKYEVVKGNHRFWAMKVLGEKEIDCVIGEYPTRDDMLADMVRDNVVKGELDPVKFTKMYEQISDKYGKDMTRKMFEFLEEDELNRLIVEVKKQLPEELREKLDEARDEIKTIDDLSIILNRLFSEYGGTLPYNFMVFKYPGSEEKVMYVKCDKETWKGIEKMSKLCEENKVEINEYLKEVFFTNKTIEEL